LSWADGDGGPQTAVIPIVKGNFIAGSPKSFTVDLSNPTNGAVLGPQAHEVVNINASPPATAQSAQPHGGGGAFDWLALLCLSCVRWLQRRALPVASREKPYVLGKPSKYQI
jgi:hypothetical protein